MHRVPTNVVVRRYSVVIFAAADIPTSLSFVFKEWSFKSAHLDVFFLTACVSWMQLAIVWLFLPLQVRARLHRWCLACKWRPWPVVSTHGAGCGPLDVCSNCRDSAASNLIASRRRSLTGPAALLATRPCPCSMAIRSPGEARNA